MSEKEIKLKRGELPPGWSKVKSKNWSINNTMYNYVSSDGIRYESGRDKAILTDQLRKKLPEEWSKVETISKNGRSIAFVSPEGKKFPSLAKVADFLFTNHLRLRRYKCKVCDKSFSKKFAYSNHMMKNKNVHIESKKQYTCNVCGKVYTSKLPFTEHKMTHTGVKPYTCDICGKSYSIKSNLTRHMHIHETKIRPYHCDLCEKTFYSSIHLNRHKMTHVDNRQDSRNLLDKENHNNHNNLESKTSDHDENTGVQGLVNDDSTENSIDVFKDKGQLPPGWTKVYSGANSMYIYVSPDGIRYESGLDKAMLTDQLRKKLPKGWSKVDTISEKKGSIAFVSPKGKKFHNLAKVADFLLTNSRLKRFQCNICDKSYSKGSSFFKHMGIHKRKKEYNCNICGEIYNHVNKAKHIFTHFIEQKSQTGRKKYKCDSCDMALYSKHNFHTHKCIHHVPDIDANNVDEECTTSEHINKLNGLNTDSFSTLINFVTCGEAIKLEDMKEDITEEESVEDPLTIQGNGEAEDDIEIQEIVADSLYNQHDFIKNLETNDLERCDEIDIQEFKLEERSINTMEITENTNKQQSKAIHMVENNKENIMENEDVSNNVDYSNLENLTVAQALAFFSS